MLEYKGELPEGWELNYHPAESGLLRTSYFELSRLAISHRDGNEYVRGERLYFAVVFAESTDELEQVEIKGHFTTADYKVLGDVILWCQVQLQEHRPQINLNSASPENPVVCLCGGQWECRRRLNDYGLEEYAADWLHFTANGKQIDVEEIS